jgi:hypothetical protein
MRGIGKGHVADPRAYRVRWLLLGLGKDEHYQVFNLGFGFFIVHGHLVATRGWSPSKPVARGGHNRRLEAEFGYGH